MKKQKFRIRRVYWTEMKTQGLGQRYSEGTRENTSRICAMEKANKPRKEILREWNVMRSNSSFLLGYYTHRARWELASCWCSHLFLQWWIYSSRLRISTSIHSETISHKWPPDVRNSLDRKIYQLLKKEKLPIYKHSCLQR